MVEPIKFKPKDDYSEHRIIKVIDGQEVEFYGIDSMTEDQWRKYCLDTGTEYFKRLNVTI
jgi:hypothetical protein